MYKLPQLPRICLVLVGILVFAPASGQSGESANFGSPEAVENRIAKDRGDREQPLKERLGEKGVELAIDYSAVALGASDVLPASDDSASGGMVRFYGSWHALNQGKPNSGSLVWKVEHRHAYSDTSVKKLSFRSRGVGPGYPAIQR